MAIIKKRMDELTVGDIVLIPHPMNPHASPSRGLVVGAAQTPGSIAVVYVLAGKISAQDTKAFHRSPADLVDVEVPDIQSLSADDLDLLITSASECVEREIGPERLRALVDRLRPPEPPTLAEALAVLASVERLINSDFDRSTDEDGDMAKEREAKALLDRARRAGLLPKEGG